jgi:hypothetical protein
MTLWLGALFASILLLCIFAIVKQRRTLAEEQRIQRLLAEAPSTRIADAPSSGRVRISGQATSADGSIRTAPFTGDAALWSSAELHTNVGSVVEQWPAAVPELVIDDGSGRVARVPTRDAEFRIPAKSAASSDNRARIAAFLASQDYQQSPQSTYFEYEAVLRPGDYVDVVGTVSEPDGGYRASGAGPIVVVGDSDGLFVVDSAWEASNPERIQRGISCAIAGAVVSAAALLITVLATHFG